MGKGQGFCRSFHQALSVDIEVNGGGGRKEGRKEYRGQGSASFVQHREGLWGMEETKNINKLNTFVCLQFNKI